MRWTQESGIIIYNIIIQCQKQNKTFHEVKKIISDSYPFGEKKNHPYKCWLKVRKEILIKFYPEEKK